MRILALSSLLLLLLAAPALAGDVAVDAMQREIIRLSEANAKLRDQLKEAKRAAPLPPVDEPVEQADKPAKRVAKPAQRAADPRAMPETRDCPYCKRGRIYGPVTTAIPVYAPGWGWGMSYHTCRAPIGMCTACGGTGRLSSSLAGR